MADIMYDMYYVWYVLCMVCIMYDRYYGTFGRLRTTFMYTTISVKKYLKVLPALPSIVV